ncbi:MAG: hypothetical protein IT348_09755 [Candidatus Eisenbacteria bacterium]|nr:hypothetical protein [Candidatus Eisenbacteria bacterium]
MRRLILLIALAVLAMAAPASAAALRNTPGLATITVHEVTFVNIPHTWVFFDDVLFARLPGTLGPGNADFVGNSTEFYDIFYSDLNGNPDPLGEFLTVECDDLDGNDSGCNIAEVELNFSNGNPTVRACSVVNFFVWGSQGSMGSVPFAADNDLNTFCSLGSSLNAPHRLSVTFTFGCHPTATQGSTWGRLKSLYR